MLETVFEVIGMLFCVIFLEMLHRGERRELYGRIMSRDEHDYIKSNRAYKLTPKPPYVLSAMKWRRNGGEDK